MHVVEIDHEVDALEGAVHDNDPPLRGVGRVVVEPGLPQIRLDQGPLLFPHSHHPLVATARYRDRVRQRPRERSAERLRWERSEEHTSELQSLAYLVCRL